MCIIAGYAGSRRAAPILIEMLKKTEYIDGGLSTGIATIHEGKLHWRKVIGDVDELLRSTDAIDLPGTVAETLICFVAKTNVDRDHNKVVICELAFANQVAILPGTILEEYCFACKELVTGVITCLSC